MPKELKLEKIKVIQLLDIDQEQNRAMNFEVISGKEGLKREISSAEINRPGLPLAGFFDHFAYERIQIFGRGEMAYINKLIQEGDTENLDKFFQYDIPVCIVTHKQEIPDYILKLAEDSQIPILRTELSTEKCISLITTTLDALFAPYVLFHGDFVSIYNIGVLIIGASGIGKSESVLGLVERGHKFISDDMVKIKKLRTPTGTKLQGEPYVDYGPYIEIRGIGIINVSQYYGEGKILGYETLRLVVKLLEWESSYDYDRIGMDEKYIDILGINVPFKEIPVSTGRNIPLLIEVAAYREVMRGLGYNSADELEKKILKFMKKEQEID